MSKSKKTTKSAAKRTKAARTKSVPNPKRCATGGCDGEAVLTHLGRARCQKCWDDECANEQAASGPGATPAAARGKKQRDKAADKSKGKRAAKPTAAKRVSALDAAAQVLKASGKPMRAQEMITAMADQKL